MSNPRSVLVVDDEEELTYLFRLYLGNSGFDSVSFTDPLEALDHYIQNHERYSVVLIDWKMPDLDGLQLAKKIRDFNASIKIVLTTAYEIEDPIRKELIEESLISDVLKKPFDLNELGPRIAALCEMEV
jgi:CheY-like chemotaxis protein